MSKNSSTKFYQDNKERQQKDACKRYQSISKEEKEKKQQYDPGIYKNLTEDEKEKLLSIEKISNKKKNT